MNETSRSWLLDLAEKLVDDHMYLFKSLKNIRIDKGISEGDMAYRMGMSEDNFKALEENWSEMSLEQLRTYCMSIGVHLDTRVIVL